MYRWIDILSILSLSNNKLLSSINEKIFSELNNLENLYLQEINIVAINKSTFNHLTNLELLYLSSNSITHIKSSTFASLTNMKWLFLYENELQIFDFELISSMNQTLRELYINKNQITEIENSKRSLFFGINKIVYCGK